MATRGESRVFVGGLASDSKAHHLAEAFSRFGTVLETEIVMDRKTGRLRGFGFITFTNPCAAHAAIRHMHNTELHGQAITVSHAYPRLSSYNHGDAVMSGKYNYFKSTSRKYGNNKNHSSCLPPYENCYRTNEGKSGNHHKSFRYYTPYEDCYDGGDDANGTFRNDNKSSSYVPPYDDCYGKNRNNSSFNCNRIEHWDQHYTYPRDREFDNHYSCYHGGPHVSDYQFSKVGSGNRQGQKGCNNRGNKNFNCGCTGYCSHDCPKERDGRSSDPHGKRPQSPDSFGYGDDDQLDYDDIFTNYCDYCDNFGHFILNCPNLGSCSTSHAKYCDCDGGPYLHKGRFDGSCMQCGGESLWSVRKNPNLGCCSTSHPKFCDCDGGPYLSEGRFDGSCMQCGDESLWSVRRNPNISITEQGESSHRPHFPGKRYDARRKGNNSDQYGSSNAIAGFSNYAQKNSRNYDPFGMDTSSEEEFFYGYGHRGKSNGRFPSCYTCCQSSRGTNSRYYDDFEKDALFKEGVFENHGRQGKFNGRSRTMPLGAKMLGERSGGRQNQYDRIHIDENGMEPGEGRDVHGQNAGAQSQPSGTHASSRRLSGVSSQKPRNGPRDGNGVRSDSRRDHGNSSRRLSGGSSRRPQNGAQGASSMRHDNRGNVNDRRPHGKDPVNVYIIVERGGKS